MNIIIVVKWGIDKVIDDKNVYLREIKRGSRSSRVDYGNYERILLICIIYIDDNIKINCVSIWII